MDLIFDNIILKKNILSFYNEPILPITWILHQKNKDETFSHANFPLFSHWIYATVKS